MTQKTRRLAAIIMIVIVAITASLSMLFTLSGFFVQKTNMTSNLTAESEENVPPLFQEYALNVSVVNEKNIALKNVWVIVFDEGVAKVFGYTNKSGKISFSILPGTYLIQFERYHYVTASQSVTIANENMNVTQIIKFEEIVFFGSIPSWLIIFIIGLIALGLVYWNRDSLKIGRMKKPDNWFGSSATGSWTFMDNSTKTTLYGTSIVLLILLILIILPNFPTFKDMAFYYTLLGGLAVCLLLIEGANKKSWIAAIGFGKQDEILGNIFLGIAFALTFIGLTGFASTLCIPIFTVPVSSLVSILMFVIIASFFEEGFFSGILAPTIAEKIGMLGSIFLTSIIFMFAHGFAYGWVILPMIIALMFRFFATIVVLQTKSWLGIFVAHAIINALSLFSFLMFL